jgi:hypothetical protein
MNQRLKRITVPQGNIRRVNLKAHPRTGTGVQMQKPAMTNSAATRPIADDYNSLQAAASAVHKIRIDAQRELEIARRLRADAIKYQKETEMKARSEAQQLILRTRLSAQKEIEELIRKSSEEIQKVLADIRVIRITAQEELAAQRKFTDAARLSTLSLSIQKGTKEKKAPANKKKEPVAK